MATETTYAVMYHRSPRLSINLWGRGVESVDRVSIEQPDRRLEGERRVAVSTLEDVGNPIEQRLRKDRLRNVVLGAEREPSLDVFVGSLPREHHERYTLRQEPDLLKEREAVDL